MPARSSTHSASTRTHKSKSSSPRLKAQAVNEKGEINTWSSSSADGKLLATLLRTSLLMMPLKKSLSKSIHNLESTQTDT
eukprot:9554566-Ditylum_brightwellii.AAC.1